MIAQPNVTIGFPDYIYVNEPFPIKCSFVNLSPTIGFIPGYDLVLPNEISLVGKTPYATWDGINWVDASNQPIVSYPNYPNATNFPTASTINDKWYLFLLSYSSYCVEQPVLLMNNLAIISAPNQLIPVTIPTSNVEARAFFLLGNSAVATSPPIYQTQSNFVCQALQISITKKHITQTANNQTTGPNYPVTYKITTHIAPGQSLTDFVIRDAMDDSFRYIANSTTTSTPLSLVNNSAPL